MNVLKSLSIRCSQSTRFQKCTRELSTKNSMLSCIKSLTQTVNPGSCSGRRRLHRHHSHSETKNNDEVEDLEAPQPKNNLLSIYSSNGAVLRLPDSYFYFNVNDHSKNFDRKPPGTHLASGAIKKKPTGSKLARIRAVALVITFIYMGGLLSSYGAQLLHEFEIFTLPEDDEL